MIQVKWVHSYQVGIAKASDEDVAMIELSALTEVVEGLRNGLDLSTTETGDKAAFANGYFTFMQRLLAQLEVRS